MLFNTFWHLTFLIFISYILSYVTFAPSIFAYTLHVSTAFRSRSEAECNTRWKDEAVRLHLYLPLINDHSQTTGHMSTPLN